MLTATAYEELKDALVDGNLISLGNYEQGVHLAKENGDSIVSVLIKLGYVSERDMVETQAHIQNIAICSQKEYPSKPLYKNTISVEFLHKAYALPLREDAGCVHIAIVDTFDTFNYKAFEKFSNKKVVAHVAFFSEIETHIERLYQDNFSEQEKGFGYDLEKTDNDNDNEEDTEILRDLASEAPVIRLVGKIISDAITMGVSDIHLQPRQDRLAVRFRVDSILYNQEDIPKKMASALASRIKVMAHLNIAEQRLPQDGRARLDVDGRRIDLRVSVLPELYGERVVLRILDHNKVFNRLEDIGFSDDLIQNLRSLLSRPNGLILVTGPTGSGKSTTLYTILREITSTERNIISVEDPVEYRLPGVSQVHVKPNIGLSFAQTLRAILRQDPDVIMIGEIRDKETAEISVHAALTGHLVLSTLHTNTAAGAVTRLLNMGVDDYLLVSALNAVISQRLVRLLCQDCCVSRDVEAEKLPLSAKKIKFDHFYCPQGCPTCQNIGYRGQVAINELIVMDDTIRNCIINHASTADIQKASRQNGSTSMLNDGLLKAAAGITSIEEVIRFAGEEN